jgi:hypothetical protein
MTDNEKTAFLQSLVAMFGCFNASAAEHVPESYWRYLKALPLWSVRRGMNRAIKESTTPQFVPTAEQIRRNSEVFAKHPPAESSEVSGLLGEAITSQLPDDNQFEKLARKWEQDIAGGKNPDVSEAKKIVSTISDAYSDWKSAAVGDREDEAA